MRAGLERLGDLDASYQSRSARALLLAALTACASAIGLVTYAFPQVPIPDRDFQIGLTLVGFPGAGLLLALRSVYGERLPDWLLHAWVAASVVLVCVGSWSARTSPTSIASIGFLVWIGLYIGSFFATRALLAHLAWIAICLALLLAVNGDASTGATGAMSFGIVLGATAAARYLASELGLLATTDPLTGLPNRQSLPEVLDREIARCKRQGGPLCVGVIDVDNLKSLNDSKGHPGGDAALVGSARHWRQGSRSIDVVVRYGGDEFVIVMPGCDLETASGVLDRLRSSGSWPCSVGVTAFEPGDTAESLFSRADRALYLAKTAGRDRVVPLPEPGGRPGAETRTEA